MITNQYWIYLERLRKLGVINMFEAVPYLMEEFELGSSDAKEILADWMENYNKEDYK